MTALRLKLALAGLAAALPLALASTPSWGGGVRCGWFDNPSPGNASLFDKDGEWILAIQGGHQAEGDWPPDFARDRWVRLGAGSYGYGCACLDVEVDAREKTVRKVVSAKTRPLSACRRDPGIAKIEKRLR